MTDALAPFSPITQAWFRRSFPAPTAAQAAGWRAISAGDHTLVLAPTGSGKTLAAFLWAIDRLASDPVPPPEQRCRVLYVSPLKALAVDVERNLRAPLAGIALDAAREGLTRHDPTVGIRTGDTSSRERRQLARTPPDVLITTPESLYLMLTSQARTALAHVDTVIIDEIHAVAPTKRGAHLALTLERLDDLVRRVDPERRVQRIGLSATQRPLDEIATFLGGRDHRGLARPVTIVDEGSRKDLDLEIVVPVPDLRTPGERLDAEPHADLLADRFDPAPVGRSIWPAVDDKLLDLIQSHRSTLIFVNARRTAERLAARLNDLALTRAGIDPDDSHARAGNDAADLVRAHHGSLAREQRTVIEDALKAGNLRGLVATSSLELGIDMGAVDLVVQVESPGSVAAGLQRVGRAGHSVGEPSRGRIFPKHRGDLLEATVVARRMRAAQVESIRYPRNPLDVVAQQIVAMCALEEWAVDDALALVRRAANFTDLTDDAFEAVLDLLAGRYPSEEFAGLAPLIVWDRLNERIRGRERAQRVAVTNPGTIPDRGLFGVFLTDGTRVGELDEEMVYESRSGDVFVLGASTWRIEEIGRDRVLVSPAPGEPAKMPFWHGDRPGRPYELGRAVGEAIREIGALDGDEARRVLRSEWDLDEWAADNLATYLAEQREATGSLPDDRTIVVERFPDEIGDWRVCIHAPFGARVLAPWALAIEANLEAELGSDVQVMWSDDGIVLRLPEAVESVPIDALVPNPDDVEAQLVERLPSTSLFAARFREAAGRALLLPKRRPGQRSALWQQRQRAADLLDVASRYPSFPIVLETMRECLRDVFDVSALASVLRDIRSRSIRVVTADTRAASPMAQSLLFAWIAVYMYEGDAPLAERRAAALALDRDLLRELLGAEELRELLDAEVVAELELDLQRLGENSRRARDADELHDLLRTLGDLSIEELAARSTQDPAGWVESLLHERRIIPAAIADAARFIAAEDAGRYRDALGVTIPIGLPAAFTEPVRDPWIELVARFAATHAPFTRQELAARFGVSPSLLDPVLNTLAVEGRIVEGAFRPDGTTAEWCDVSVLRQLRRRSLARLRAEIEPVDGTVYAQFLSAWHGIDAPRSGIDALVDAIAMLQGVAIPASALESDVLAARIEDYRPSMLDELTTAGEVVWFGAGSIAGRDGRVVLAFRDQAAAFLPRLGDDRPEGPIHDALRARLATGAAFWPDLRAANAAASDAELLAALWDLVWVGEVTNDSVAPLRSWLQGTKRANTTTRGRVGRLSRSGPPAGAGRWSLVALPTEAPSATVTAHTLARQLLDRYGVVTREGVKAEGVAGGFAAVYPILKELEERGQVRRGWFVAGLGAAQFALAGAVDRLRAERVPDRAPTPLLLAATDPAQPYGAALTWPEPRGEQRPTRTAGARVLLADGVPLAWIARDAVVTFLDATTTHGDAIAATLAEAVRRGTYRTLEITRIDGRSARESPLAESLRAAGFQDGYRGLVLRRR